MFLLKPTNMKTFKICIAVVILLIFGIGLACEHCDEIDYEREKRESAENLHLHNDSTHVEVD